MEIDVEVLNVLKYEDKENKGSYKTRISYRLLDPSKMSNTDKFKGFSELSIYLDGTKLFDVFDSRYCGCALKFVLEEKPSNNNPLRKYITLKEVKTENGKSLCVL